jgi:hypothetical protein
MGGFFLHEENGESGLGQIPDCPICSSSSTLEIIYGYWNPGDYLPPRSTIGGCILQPHARWGCEECNFRWDVLEEELSECNEKEAQLGEQLLEVKNKLGANQKVPITPLSNDTPSQVFLFLVEASGYFGGKVEWVIKTTNRILQSDVPLEIRDQISKTARAFQELYSRLDDTEHYLRVAARPGLFDFLSSQKQKELNDKKIQLERLLSLRAFIEEQSPDIVEAAKTFSCADLYDDFIDPLLIEEVSSLEGEISEIQNRISLLEKAILNTKGKQA